MGDFLVFRLAAALAATGDVAAQARRDVERWPARSAVLGVVGAALGLRRDDADDQGALESGYDVGVRVREVGTLLRDYHTVQTVPSGAVKRPRTRADALEQARSKDALNTILTEREYREGMYAEVALSSRDGARWTFEELADALKRPRFVLYFGRKACPLTSPVHPVRVEASDVLTAFERYAALPAHEASPECPPVGTDAFAALDVGLGVGELVGAERLRRWDAARDRRRWHFAERDVLLVPPKRPEPST